ncbi:MAG: AsmA family protein [Hylemonella sp.]
MNKALKIFLLALAAVLVLALAVLAYVAATFDPNAYKPRLIELVRTHTGRTLSLPGDIRLTLWPRIGAQLGAVSLSEPGQEQVFAAVQDLRVSVALWPLLSRQVVVDRIQIEGLQLRIARDRQGRYNFADLLPQQAGAPAAPASPSAEPAAALPALDIGGIDIRRARIDYSDAASGQRLTVAALGLRTGAIADGRSSRLELAAELQGQAPALQLRLAADGDFTPQLAEPAVQFKNLRLRLDGQAAGLTELQLELRAPALQASAQRAQAPALTLQAAARQGAARYEGQLGGALLADWAQQRYTLGDLQVQAFAPNPAGGTLQLQARGQLSAELQQEQIRLNLDGRLDQTTLALKAGIQRLAQPLIDFDLALGALDIDRYRRAPATGAPAAAPAAPAGPATAEPVIDLSALRGLNLRGTLGIESLQAMNLKATGLRLPLRVQQGRAEAGPIAATLYGGSLQGTVQASAGQPQQLGARLDLREVQLGPLLQDLLGQQPLDGRGRVSLDLRTSGQTLSGFKRHLNGQLAVQLRDGAIRGINLAALLRDAKARLAGGASGSTAAQEKTDFSELSASWRITDGVARNDDLSGKSPLLRLGGSGTIYLPEDRLDYTLKATVVPTLQGQGGPELEQLRGLSIPVRISGPYQQLGWQLDLGATALGRAREQLDERKVQLQQETQRRLDEEKAKAQQRLQQQAEDRLKQLLGR